ncbi:MAG: DUF2007 domain-containing protein [Candidatus Cloacimonadota bacterium]|nr:DUF2007 domain-containing protein [Candidatus Cloacimonadota bacterium]
MICLKCGKIYKDSVKRCPDCDIPLFDENKKTRLVTVLQTGDPGTIAIAKSILDEANIPYYIANEHIQDLIGIGRFGYGFNPLSGPTRIKVGEEDAEVAQKLLDKLK